jgi:hypothetical protein
MTKRSTKHASSVKGMTCSAYNLRQSFHILDKTQFKAYLKEVDHYLAQSGARLGRFRAFRFS